MSRLSKQWGAICDLGLGSHGGRTPDAIILSHSAWPMLDHHHHTSTCDVDRYAQEVDRLIEILIMRQPPIFTKPRCSAYSAEPPDMTTMSLPYVFWLGQPKAQAPAAKLCLASGRWQAVQAAALDALRMNLGVKKVRRLDSWHIVDAAETCQTQSECLASPSPRLRDHLHYNLPVYAALAQNLLNNFCGA